MKFFHDREVRQLFGAAVALGLIFPALYLALVYPKYRAQMLETVKHEAGEVAHHLAHQVRVVGGQLRVDFSREAEPFLLQDFGLLEIQVLDKRGVVIYSNDAKDIGKVNDQVYFQEVVAQGQKFSNVIVKGDTTSDGEIINQNIIEVYVPIMIKGAFVGACGLHYNINVEQGEFNRIYFSSLVYPLPLILIFLGLVGYILKSLDGQIAERRRDQEEIEAQRNVLLLEQKRHCELLKNVEYAKKQWEATMDRVDDMVIMVNSSLQIRRCNKAVCTFTSLGFTEILGQCLTDLFVGLDFDNGKADGKAFEYVHAVSNRFFSITIYSISLDAEQGWVVTAHDLSEIKKVTSELERTNEKISKTSLELQRTIDQISNYIQRVIAEEDFEVSFQYDFPEKCYEAMGCRQTDCPCYGKEAGSCWNETGTFCEGRIQGQFAQKYGSCRECTYFKRMTANPVNMIGEQFNNMMYILSGKNTELRAANAELKQAQSHLLQQEKMASIGQLAAGVAHEINNPVGFISSNLGSLRKYSTRLADYIKLLDELVREAASPEISARQVEERKKFKVDLILTDIDDLIRESLDGCDRVKKIVQDLKSFSRVDQAQEQTVNIHECLDTTINMVWNELKYHATLSKDYQATRPVHCFPQQLNQVFMNLLVNAAHAIEKEGVITIKTWEDEAFSYVAISDTGCGIPPENIDHIFEPFFTTKEIGKGTGLGLSIVYDIVTKNHHGDILVDSQVGQGTTFTVKLPAECPSS